MLSDKLIKMMIEDEGERFKPYLDDNQNVTIGIGYNLTGRGISKKISRMLFKECMDKIITDLNLIFIDQNFFAFPENIQKVLFNMRFQMGYTGFRRFKKMIACVKVYDWVGTIKEMIDSNWYRNYTTRAERLIKLVKQEEQHKFSKKFN